MPQQTLPVNLHCLPLPLTYAPDQAASCRFKARGQQVLRAQHWTDDYPNNEVEPQKLQNKALFTREKGAVSRKLALLTMYVCTTASAGKACAYGFHTT